MKTLMIIFSVMCLSIVSCNKGDQAGSVGSGAGIEKQENRGQNNQYQMDDANITTPIDNRPDLEEEE